MTVTPSSTEAKLTTEMQTKVKEAIEKLTLTTDVVKEVEPTTENHYSLNKKFLVIRDNKEYFISIKIVDVIGQVIKSHVRLDIDTNLPVISKTKTIDFERIAKIEKKILKFSQIANYFKSKFPDNYQNFCEYTRAIGEIQRGEKLIKRLKS